MIYFSGLLDEVSWVIEESSDLRTYNLKNYMMVIVKRIPPLGKYR